jgi:bifunctional non-homologous end joining protein LigD
VSPTPPRLVTPMKATLAPDPPHDDENWAYEIKWDGMRAVGFVRDGSLRLQTVNGLDASERFPELAPLASALSPHEAVLDGEIVTFDEDGRPSFGLLQPRMQARKTTTAHERAVAQPVFYVLFDLLELDGNDITDQPYEARRALLLELVEPGPHWKVSEGWIGGGAELLEVMRAQGMEGLIAKRLGSRYETGRRTRNWLKLKVRRRQEFVVGGWLSGEGNRSDHFGSLLIGYHDRKAKGSPLRYAGRVGTGFNEAELTRLLDLLRELDDETCPFDPEPPRPVALHGHWVRPELVVEVEFGEWTKDAILRHPAYVGQRVDKPASKVVREDI